MATPAPVPKTSVLRGRGAIAGNGLPVREGGCGMGSLSLMGCARRRRTESARGASAYPLLLAGREPVGGHADWCLGVSTQLATPSLCNAECLARRSRRVSALAAGRLHALVPRICAKYVVRPALAEPLQVQSLLAQGSTHDPICPGSVRAPWPCPELTAAHPRHP